MMDRVLAEVFEELKCAQLLHPQWPTDPLHAVAILGEEYGELVQSVLQASYEHEKSTPAHVRIEAIQTAAMALRFLLSLDQYVYGECDHHDQLA